MLRFFIAALLLTWPTATLSQNFAFFGTYWFTGAGRAHEAVGLGIPASEMQKAFDAHTDDGLEMHLIDAYDVNGEVFFNFVFRARTSSKWTARFGLTSGQYQRAFDNNIAAGRCLRHLDVYRTGNGSVRYAAIFKSDGCVAQRAYHGASASKHQELFEGMVDNGWDPVNVSVTSVGGTRTYAAFYEKRPGTFSLKSFLTTDGVGEHDAKMRAQGMRIVYMDAYTHDQNTFPRYSAIWRKAGPIDAGGHNLGGPQVADLGEDMHNSGRYVRYLTGFGMPPASHRYNVAAFKPRRSGAVGTVGGIASGN